MKILGEEQLLAPNQQLSESHDTLAVLSEQTLSLTASGTPLRQPQMSWALCRCLQTTMQRLQLVAPAPESSASARVVSNHFYLTFCYCRPLWTLDDPVAMTLRLNRGAVVTGAEARL